MGVPIVFVGDEEFHAHCVPGERFVAMNGWRGHEMTTTSCWLGWPVCHPFGERYGSMWDRWLKVSQWFLLSFSLRHSALVLSAVCLPVTRTPQFLLPTPRSSYSNFWSERLWSVMNFEIASNPEVQQTLRWGQRGMPCCLHTFFNTVAHTPSSFATWLIGRWKCCWRTEKVMWDEVELLLSTMVDIDRTKVG